MKSRIYELGVIDKNEKKHPVYFNEGLNIVTGMSSTGKSALIEIFDYCMGSSEETIPEGKITENTALYYVCISLNSRIYVFSRNSEGNRLSIIPIDKHDKDIINKNFFNPKYSMTLGNFKGYLRKEFLDISSVDESEEVFFAKGNNESRPSIRSFMSFMLQHQNLIANKHALFYRFDQKEKREHVINHTKFFLGFVKQEYFLLSKQKEKLEKEISNLEKQEQAADRFRLTVNEKIAPVLHEIYILLGADNFEVTADDIFMAPQISKDKIKEIVSPNNIKTESNSMDLEYGQVENEIHDKSRKLSKVRLDIRILESSLNAEDRLIEKSGYLNHVSDTHVGNVVCPFCNTEDNSLKNEAQNLEKAILKLNNHLNTAKIMKAPLQVELDSKKQTEKKLQNEIKSLRQRKTELNESMTAESRTHISELLLDKKYQLFNMIDMLNPEKNDFEGQLKEKKLALGEVNSALKKYNWKQSLLDAEKEINRLMKNIGKNFNFEAGYKPINLKFSLESFDLYHDDEKKGKKIYLRSMGSGANWLYCHLTLFMALHSYFVSLGEECLIPTTLFLDQPTQVYFPNFNRDKNSEFSKEKIQELEGKEREEIDADVLAVTNIFNQLYNYCEQLKKQHGFCPQIIVTDHADYLDLDNVEFESLVNGNRWRTRGLIN